MERESRTRAISTDRSNFSFFSLSCSLRVTVWPCVSVSVSVSRCCVCVCVCVCDCMYVSTYLLCGNGVEGVDKRFFFVAAATSHARSDLAASVHPESTKSA